VKSVKRCLDASFVLKLVLIEEHSELAKSLWASWREQLVDIVAPPYLLFEASSSVAAKPSNPLILPRLS